MNPRSSLVRLPLNSDGCVNNMNSFNEYSYSPDSYTYSSGYSQSYGSETSFPPLFPPRDEQSSSVASGCLEFPQMYLVDNSNYWSSLQHPISPIAPTTIIINNNFYHPFCYPVQLLSINNDPMNVSSMVKQKKTYNVSNSNSSYGSASYGQSFDRTSKPWKELMDSEIEIPRNNQLSKVDKMEIQPAHAITDSGFHYSGFTDKINRASTPVADFEDSEMDSLDLSYIKNTDDSAERLNLKRKREVSSIHNKENTLPCKKPRKTIKKIKQQKEAKLHCQFCRESGEPPIIYNHHTMHDEKGRCNCPVLRQIVCPICNADGDRAHTIRDCPRKRLRVRRENASIRTVQKRFSCINI